MDVRGNWHPSKPKVWYGSSICWPQHWLSASCTKIADQNDTLWAIDIINCRVWMLQFKNWNTVGTIKCNDAMFHDGYGALASSIMPVWILSRGDKVRDRDTKLSLARRPTSQNTSILTSMTWFGIGALRTLPCQNTIKNLHDGWASHIALAQTCVIGWCWSREYQ